MKYVKGFDVLRAIAVLLVIVDEYHWGPIIPANTWAGALSKAIVPDGRFGVTLFFVLSGFLISSILLKETYNGVSVNKMSIVKTFYMRRFFRIFPIYYLVILLFLLLKNSFVVAHAGYFLFYCSNFLQLKPGNVLLHTWSLAVEEQFYLIWPWLLVFIDRRYLKYVLVFCIVLGTGFKYYEYYVLHGNGYLLLSCFDYFSIGGLYAYVRSGGESEGRKFENSFIVLLTVMLFIAWRLNQLGGAPMLVMYQKFLDGCVALGAIIFVLRNKNAIIDKYLLNNRFLIFIGKISYGIYLYHFFLDQPLKTLYLDTLGMSNGPAILSSTVFVFAFKFSVLLLLSWLSFLLIEKPILNLKKRFTY
jgi:peptidoglycan/LPS O-acetylase OafA/YrhL